MIQLFKRLWKYYKMRKNYKYEQKIFSRSKIDNKIIRIKFPKGYKFNKPKEIKDNDTT